MEFILLSTDGPVSLYLVPKCISENLFDYCIEFCRWIQSSPEAYKLRIDGYFPQEEFINYINKKIITEESIKACFIKKIEDSETKIPNEYKNLPHFNF